MKYNRSEIMIKAARLRRTHEMDMSESLRKAWAMAKLGNLESRKFILECKDHWYTADYIESHTLNSAINKLKSVLFPRIVTKHSRDKLCAGQRERLNKTLAELKAVKNPDFSTQNRIWDIEHKLANSIETWTSSRFDESVYGAM